MAPAGSGPARADRPQQRWFDGPAGRLDARLHGRGRPLLLLHPHPAHGGTMGTRLVHRLAEELAADGWRTVRFDFRGAGRSEGAYDEGRGETEDATAVWDALAQEAGPAPVVGFSFGAGVAVRLAGRRDVPALVLVAPPKHVRASGLHPVQDAKRVRCPAHMVVGSEDELVPAADAEEVRAALPEARITVLQGADHFLAPEHHDRAVHAVREALEALDQRP